MISTPLYSLTAERRAAELQQSVIRILLSIITSLVLIKNHLDISVGNYNNAGTENIIFISAAFLLYSTAVWVFERYLPEYIHVTMLTASVVDIVMITLLMPATFYTQIPFYIWYIFYVVNVSSKYGWQYSIMALSASIVSFSWVLGVYSSAVFSAFAMGAIGYLLVLAFMFGQISERQLTYQSFLAVVNEFRAELAGMTNARDIMVHVLERTKGLLKVEQTFFLPAHRGADASLSPGFRSQGTDPVLMATFRESGGIFNVEQVLQEQRPIMSNKIHSDITMDEVGKMWNKLHNIIAAPMMLRNESIGVLYAVNRKDKRFSRSDLLLLEVIATQIAPIIENVVLWERIREAATAEERLRIARDLHDSVLQTLAAINIHVERCRILMRKDSSKAQQGLEKIQEISTHALAEVRSYLSNLRITGPEPAKFESFVRKLCIDSAAQANMSPEVNIDVNPEMLPAAVSTTAFQLIGELVNNATTHSHGKNITIDIKQDHSSLNIQLTDDGVGFDVEPTRAKKATMGHMGLIGLEERVRAARGTFEIQSAVGTGTTVKIRLPF